MKEPIKVTVTGAAGQIAYSLVFRIGYGAMLGFDQPVILQLLDLPQTQKSLEGVLMELDDCAYPLLKGVDFTDDPNIAFKDTDIALLVGAKPRGPGMERNDLLQENGEIFKIQGKAINDYASRDVKVLVVGNPANTNALIAMKNAPDLNPKQFTAMTRLDHNRALSMIARKVNLDVSDIHNMTVWGNHSSTQYPDASHVNVAGKPALELLDDTWINDSFIPTVQKRGAAILKARGKSSAASAGFAAMDHIKSWCSGTPENDWVSMAIPSDGSYGIPEGVIYSFPVTIKAGEYAIVQGLDISDYSRNRMDISYNELLEEKEMVKDLFLS